MGTLDFSEYEEQYKDKDLPRYVQYEIIRRLYALEEDTGKWDRPHSDEEYIFFAKLNFIIGYEYLRAGCQEAADQAFRQSLERLEAFNQRFNGAYLTSEYYLYKGSVMYFLGNPDEALTNYEYGIKRIVRYCYNEIAGPYPELSQLNSFYINGKEVLGAFSENPFHFAFRIRNIAFMRWFNITFDEYLLGIMLFLGLLAGWAAASRFDRRYKDGPPSYVFILLTFPVSLELAALYIYNFKVYESIRSILLVCGTWFLIYKIAQTIIRTRFPQNIKLSPLLKKRYKSMFLTLQILPWIMFWNYAEDLMGFQMIRFLWKDSEYWYPNMKDIDSLYNSLYYWLPLTLWIYIVHLWFSLYCKKEKPGVVYSIFSFFFSIVGFVIPIFFYFKERMNIFNEDYYFLLIGVIWYSLFVWFEYKVARPLSSTLPLSSRLRFAFTSRHWHFIGILFLIIPAVFNAYPQREHFSRSLLYMLLWPAITVTLFLLHYLMAKLFPESKQKTDYSILITLISLVVMYVAMPLTDVSKYRWEEIPILYLVGGTLWFCILYQYRQRSQFISILNYNRFWRLVEIGFIVIPLIYIYIWSNTAVFDY